MIDVGQRWETGPESKSLSGPEQLAARSALRHFFCFSSLPPFFLFFLPSSLSFSLSSLFLLCFVLGLSKHTLGCEARSQPGHSPLVTEFDVITISSLPNRSSSQACGWHVHRPRQGLLPPSAPHSGEPGPASYLVLPLLPRMGKEAQEPKSCHAEFFLLLPPPSLSLASLGNCATHTFHTSIYGSRNLGRSAHETPGERRFQAMFETAPLALSAARALTIC